MKVNITFFLISILKQVKYMQLSLAYHEHCKHVAWLC